MLDISTKRVDTGNINGRRAFFTRKVGDDYIPET